MPVKGNVISYCFVERDLVELQCTTSMAVLQCNLSDLPLTKQLTIFYI